MKLTKEEAKNILEMINSADTENGYIAIKALEQIKFSSAEKGYLIYFYKFGKLSAHDWQIQSSKIYKQLNKLLDIEEQVYPLTFAKAFSLMISIKTKKEILELFLERHVYELVKSLGQMGYPVDKIDFNVKLKE